ncbi:MAG TPA: hypothetical protein VHK27_08750 [Gammaproteobacteria bacterium]|nr:hypothetical protein [Gammaproteobacteria bacterium]
MTSICIGLDPGETTGWFEIWPDGSTFYAELGRNEVESALESRMHLEQVLVGCERFVTSSETAKKAPEHGAMDQIGVIKNTCSKYDNCQLVFSTPADKKRVPDQLLRKLGWWVPGFGHAMDGARHALLALANNDLILFDKITAHVIL